MNTYLKEATDFLNDCNVNLRIQGGLWDKKPLWIDEDDKKANYGLYYVVTLANSKGEKYTFDFWDSIHNKEQNKKPNAYDILACLDTFADGYSFKDFCSCYGYDTDSRKAKKTYQLVLKQIEGLKRVFTAEQLEKLNEIQ